MSYRGLTREGIETANRGKTVIIKNWRPYCNQKDKRGLPISMIFMISEPLGNTIVGYSLDDNGIVTLQLEFSPIEGDRLYVSMAEYLFQKECESRVYVFQGEIWQEVGDDKNTPLDIGKNWDMLDAAIMGNFG